MANYNYVDGVDDLLRVLEFDRRQFNATAKKCMREAANSCAKKVKQSVPDRWRQLVKGRAGVAPDGTVRAGFGLAFTPKQFNGKQPNNGAQMPDWFKAYWRNYGTLEGRDASHSFKNPIKPASTQAAKSRKSRTGEKAENFFETAVDGFEKNFEEALSKAIDKHKEKLLKQK